MFSVAICDDDEVFCDELKHMVENHLQNLGIEYQIRVYTTVQNIMYDLSEGTIFDVLFLDIVFTLEENDGVYLGNYLRESLKNDYSQIVYVSVNQEYAMKLFETRPLNFLLKPVDQYKVNKTIDKVLDLQKTSRQTFTYCYNMRKYRLELGKILYFESQGRKIRIVCKDGSEYFYNGVIYNVYDELKDSKFFRPHKAYVVNFYAVDQWSREELVLVNGDRIPVSRKKVEEIRQLQWEYERSGDHGTSV